MSKTYIRLTHFTRADEFKKIKAEWEQEHPDTVLLPCTMRIERTKAKWEPIQGYNVLFWRCSNCKMPFALKYNFCPQCGAEMEGTK